MNDAPSSASQPDYEAVVREAFQEIWTKHDWSAAERSWAPDIVVHIPTKPEPLRGLDAVRTEHWEPILEAFPDIAAEVHDVVATDDRVASRSTLRGTHTGEFESFPPTGRSFAMDIFIFYRFDGAHVTEMWTMPDAIGQMQQLGLMPAGPPPRALLFMMRVLGRLRR